MSDLDLSTSPVSLENHPEIVLVEMVWKAPRSHDSWQTVDDINDTTLTEVTTVGHFLGVDDAGTCYRIAGSIDTESAIGRDVMYIPVSLALSARALERGPQLPIGAGFPPPIHE